MKWFDIADELLPPIYRAIKDMYAYAKAVNGELLSWVSYMERILNNFYIQNCDSSTLSYWEELLNVEQDSEPIEIRRKNILSLLNNSNPTTESYVRNIIEKTFPNDEYHLWFDVQNNKPYDLNIDIFTSNVSGVLGFKEWLLKMCPAHLKQTIARAIRSNFDRNIMISHAERCAISSSLGVVTRAQLPPLMTGILGGDGIRLYASGDMKTSFAQDNSDFMSAEFSNAGGRVEVWKSSFEPSSVVFPESKGETDLQMLSGTIRKWGTKANRDIGFKFVVGYPMENGEFVQPNAGTFSLNDYVSGGIIEVWNSSYIAHNVIFPEFIPPEYSSQMIGGTIRSWGNKANRGINNISLSGFMPISVLKTPLKSFKENNDVYGEQVKVYNKTYIPVIVEFPDAPETEPNMQFASGTIRIFGEKANRCVKLSDVNGGSF